MLRKSRDERGITMVEMMMAIFVFAVVMAALVPVFGTSLRVSGTNRNRSVAANLAAQEMDIVRSSTFTSLPLGLVTSTQAVDGVTYTINRESEWVTQSASSGPCTGGSGSNLAFLRVTVSVDWPNRGAIPMAQSQTAITPPIGAYDPTKGNVAVQVLDRNGQPLSGHLVTLAGPSSGSQVTPSDGCAFFPFLTSGAYTVSVNTAGYVDQQGVSSPSQPASVTAGTTTSIQFIYDRAAGLNLTFQGNGLAVPPTNAAVSVANTTLLPNGKKVFQGSGNPRSVGGLFPFTAGYSAWAGDCMDADPEGKDSGGNPYWPGASRASPLVVNPGSTTSGTVTLSTYLITVLKNGVPVPDVGIKTVHAPDTNGCTSGNTLGYSGLTDANGQFLAAIPFGVWQVEVVGMAPAGSWPSIPADPRVVTTTSLTVNVV